MLDRLRREHAEMLTLCDRLTEDEPGALDTLQSFLESHFDYEDSTFYPAFEAAAAKDARLLRVATTFATDCKQVTADAKAYFSGRTGDGGQRPSEHDVCVQALHEAILNADTREEAVEVALRFFDKTPALWHDDGVPANAAALTRLIRERIQREERILFPLFERYGTGS